MKNTGIQYNEDYIADLPAQVDVDLSIVKRPCICHECQRTVISFIKYHDVPSKEWAIRMSYWKLVRCGDCELVSWG